MKCIQLKTRLNEIEEANDAARLRVERLNRTIYKGRLERAFLLESVAKRTSTNVEDSEGSPSPPPTVCLVFCQTTYIDADKLTDIIAAKREATTYQTRTPQARLSRH